jgi:hypothetical protein
MFVHTGDYMEHTRNNAMRSTYYTFTPVPLMDGSFYTMNDDLAALLTEAHRLLGVLEGMASFHPDKEIFHNWMLFRESCFSRMIDYAEPDINEALTKKAVGNPFAEISNIVSAYRCAAAMSSKKLNVGDIAACALHGDNPLRSVSTRSEPMFLSYSTSSYQEYNPTAPRNIWKAMQDMHKYMESDTVDTLIRAAMTHYQFEIIHPYERYNGIVGRILPYNMLMNADLQGIQFLSLSAFLYRYKAEYFDKLGSTQKNGNYTAWIEFFIRVLCEAAQSAVSSIRHYDMLIRGDEGKVLARPQGRADHTLEVCLYFKNNITASIGKASAELKLSYDTVSRSVAILQKLGILTQVSEGSRNRLFAYEGIMKRFVSPE